MNSAIAVFIDFPLQKPYCLLLIILLSNPLIMLMISMVQLTAVLHAGSWAVCHNFLIVSSWFSRRSKQSRSLFTSESVTLLVKSLYTKATESVKSPDVIFIPGEINLEVRLWNCSKSVYFLLVLERLLVLTSYSMWKTIGKWSESRTSEIMTSDSLIFWWIIISNTTTFSLFCHDVVLLFYHVPASRIPQ
jgi:hypothetical protein